MPIVVIRNLCSKHPRSLAGVLDRSLRSFRRDRGASAPRQEGQERPGVAIGSHMQAILRRAGVSLALLVILSQPRPALSLSPVQGDHIVNSARLSFAESSAVAASVTVTVINRTPATIEFLKYAPSLAGAVRENVAPTAYRTGSDSGASFATSPPPLPFGSSTPIDLGMPVPLAAANAYHAGEPIFIRLTDLDQNLDRTARDTVLVTVTNPTTGDVEVLRLTETAPDTGVFIGYVQSIAGIPAKPYDGTFTVATGNSIKAAYTDTLDGSDATSSAAMVDPYGIVFDSRSGQPVAGAIITLIDVATGEKATVFADDGVSPFPASITTGASGGFRFPFVNPGTYRYQVAPPAGYTGPSAVPDAALLALPGGPFAVVTPGSRWEPFTINPGPVIHIDIPLDSTATDLWLQKSAGKDIVAAGDFLPYQLDVRNNNAGAPAPGITFLDTLPFGFRYQQGSVTVNGLAVPDPAVSPDGRTLTFTLGDLAAGGTGSVRYVVEVAAGAPLGIAVNQAIARSSSGAVSNLAKVSVQVRSDFLSSTSVIMGQVIAGACDAPAAAAPPAVAGIRIFLEDGTFVDTDKQGMFHFEGAQPGSHVVQIDLDSLPETYQIIPCVENSRFAGNSSSQFVDLQGGTVWRADFHIVRKPRQKPPVEQAVPLPPVKGEVELELASFLHGETIVYQVLVQGNNMRENTPQLDVTLPVGVAYEPNSSELNGVPLADPSISGTVLTYPLGSRSGSWSDKLRFRAAVPRNGTPDTLRNSAVLTFTSPNGTGWPSPTVENVMRRVTEKNRLQMPDLVLHPHFPTFGAELNKEDREMLDELAKLLMVLNIEQIKVTGHTDNVRIAPRSREVYRDNRALSLARAESVGYYLIEALHLPASKLAVSGMGDTVPLADNRSSEGRALNRRVEVTVQTERVTNTTRLAPEKVPNGVQKMAIYSPAAAPVPPVAAKEEEPEPAPPVGKDDGIQDKEGILSPVNGYVMAQPIHAVRICLNSQLAPHLFLDSQEVSSDRIGFTMKDVKSGKSIYSYIGIDFGEKGEHTLRLTGTDPFGNSRFEQKITVTRTGAIGAIRVKSADGNSADGKTPVTLRLEVLDTAGQVIPAEVELDIRGGTLRPLKKECAIPDPAMASDTKVHVDAAGNVLFQPVNNGGPYRTVLGYNNVTVEAETYVKPKLRDWILVGLGEGTVGYNAVSGNMESLQATDQEEHFYENGRVAFYAKGKVKGEWLLTVAYDSGKGKGRTVNSLFQTIDPNTYYTLYGDASQQQYDAASSRKLYLKIERDQFYALFGDFDTGLTVTELSRYSRRLNGVKAEWQGKNFEANVFGTETTQAYARDELQGDGTSFLYHLSTPNIVLNSDKITIETRDRFRSEVIVESRQLTRYLDYSIDYDAGTLLFKERIPNRDDHFNPIFIVAEYETVNTSSQALTYGGRVGAKLLDQRLKTGVTYIHEGQVSGEGNSYGLDALYKIGTGTTLKGEVARTDTNFGGASKEGNAYLAEVEHHSPRLEGRLYYRELGENFGLGQQNQSEAGTRKVGVDAAYKLTDAVNLGGQAYRQYNLSTGAIRDVFEGKSSYTSGPYSSHIGLLHAGDRLDDGSSKTSNQITMGGSWLTLNKRLTLKVDHDQSIGGDSNADFPTRTTFGANFKLTPKVEFFAQHEITSGAGARTNMTGVGMKAAPWEGGAINTSLGQNLNENGERIFALFGLKQTWKITDKWSVDGGVDRSQTIKKADYYQFNVNVPPASGDTQNFTAVSVGSTYQEKKWSWNSRLEVRTSDGGDKWGIMTSFVGEPKEGWGWSARCQIFDTRATDSSTKAAGDLRLGLVFRPLYTSWIILDRLDLLYDRERPGSGSTAGTSGSTFSMDNRRAVNNLSANLRPDTRSQVSFQYGAKYVLETIDSRDYSGYTDLAGIEGSYDLTKEWDVGLRGSVLHSWHANQLTYSSGASVGYSIVKNTWISLGYNVVGFSDKDFSVANYTAQGPYVRFRFKFDQNSVKEAVTWLNAP